MGLITKTKRAPAYSYAQFPFKSVESFNHDGLELARVRRARSRGLPIRQFALFLLAVLAFKVFLYMDLGGAAYGAKIEEFQQGSQIERAAGWAMQLDPVSAWLVGGLQHGAW